MEKKYKKVAVIIGASRFIGLEIVKKMVSAGYDIAATDLNDKMKLLNKEMDILRNSYDIKIKTYELDIKNISMIEDVYSKINKEYGRIDVLVNNAGVNYLVPALDVDEKIWSNVVDVNLKGCFFSMKSAAKIMIMNNGGSIINIASQHGIVGNKDRAPYCASKAGLINLTKALSYEWAKHKIRVNAVSPTFVINEMNREFLEQTKQKKQYLYGIPLKEYCKPEDVADAVEYLATERSKMVTGHNLVVDGGWTAI